MIERVKEIDNNEELYMQMLREPALLSDRSRDEYERDLEEFLVNMVETPRKLAVRRTDICWQGLTARMRLEAYKKLYYTAVYNFFKRL